MTRASVIIPCHDKVATLPLVVDSVLRQSVQDLEVIMLGDGVTDPTRAAIEALVEADPRVRFLDFPKGPHHGEAYRHDAVLAAESDAIFYLCDDDLLLPEHVADLLELLETANFVQCLNGFIRPDGTVGSYAADLGDPVSVDPILDESIRFNSVSITGTAHTREFYLAGEPWETSPPNEWPDHHQYRRMARNPAYVGATSSRMTALQMPTSGDGRDAWTEADRVAELERWHEVVTAPDGQDQIDELYLRGLVVDHAFVRPELVRRIQDIADQRAYIEQLEGMHAEQYDQLVASWGTIDEFVSKRDRQRGRVNRLLARASAAEAEVTTLRAELDALRGSRSWRLTAPLRSLRRR